jgi:hypothetical protein
LRVRRIRVTTAAKTKTKTSSKKSAVDEAHDHAQDRLDVKDVAGAREGYSVGNGAAVGRIDNMTRFDDSDVLEGHFCRIDLNHADVPDDLRESGRDYGVYDGPGSVDPDSGRPVLARVKLRDSGGNMVVVPYEYTTLFRSGTGGR